MTRRAFLRGLVAGTAGLATAPSGRALARSAAMNFVFILLDDLGWRDLGCTGSTFYETPEIDGLAARSVVFSNAYAACPVCSPTRASILTGRYPARLKLTDYLVGTRRGRLNPAEYVHHLPLEECTLAKTLRDHGYVTGFIGKWHLGPQPFWPESHGFDLNIGGCELGHPPTYFYPYERGGIGLHLPGGHEGEYLTDRLTDEALRFLDATAGRPFLLYLCHYAVHNPQEAKPELIARHAARAAKLATSDEERYADWRGRRVRQVQDSPVYAAMIESVDESVGRICRRLTELGVSETTAIILTSDNGGLSTSEGTPTANVPLSGGKGWLYEGGIRVPLIVRWPGITDNGRTCGEPVTSTDFYPTMLCMAGLPLRPEQHIDGVDLTPLLRGGSRCGRDALYWHYPHYGNQGGAPSGAVRSGGYKLMEWYEDRSVELYDLNEDIGENRNLAHDLPDVARELREMLHEWRRSVEANMPTPNPDWVGS